MFFPGQGEPCDTTICKRCPVKRECLEAGMHEKFGIWGGTSEKQRRRLRASVAYDDLVERSSRAS